MILAAGGTGGHLFPAFALAQELARRGIAVDLVTDMRGDRYGSNFPARAIYRVPSATLSGKSVLGYARTAVTLARGVVASWRLMGTLRPSAVVGFGGYPAFPPLVAASLRGIPTALHEQNAVLGRANRMLLSRVSAIATSFERVKFLDGAAASKARFTGNPVRDVVTKWADTGYVAPDPQGPFSLLVFGGSQGARFFSDVVPGAVARLSPELRQRLFIVQQCRPEDMQRVETAYRVTGVRSQLATFFANLPEEMAKSHLVIGRAGASTVAELTVIGRPSILVPLPHAIDNDQLQNATRLAESGGAWCIEQKELTAERLAGALARLMEAPQALAEAAAAARAQGRPDAVARLADLVGELISGATKNT